MPAHASFIASRSRMSASRKSILLRISVRLSRFPVEKLSTPLTSCPSSTNLPAMVEPMNPATPVTRYLPIGIHHNQCERFRRLPPVYIAGELLAAAIRAAKTGLRCPGQIVERETDLLPASADG